MIEEDGGKEWKSRHSLSHSTFPVDFASYCEWLQWKYNMDAPKLSGPVKISSNKNSTKQTLVCPTLSNEHTCATKLKRM